MIDVLNLALPFFGLIFIEFACGSIKRIPNTALACQIDVRTEEASGAVLIGTPAPVVTLIAVMWMAKTGTLSQLLSG